jgi:DNA sulfur modification protein DndB
LLDKEAPGWYLWHMSKAFVPDPGLRIPVLVARCGQLPVILGSAPAKDLFKVSFADVLDESAQVGYQRPCDRQHAEDFRTYIETAGATTIPLTLNLRGSPGLGWCLEPPDLREGELAELRLGIPSVPKDRVVARVDCQHRLEMMGESSVPLAFQCFLGLTPAEEMRVFNVINSKVKGLSPSLIDYHQSVLLDVVHEAADLYIAKRLNDDPDSVWHHGLKLGGAATQGAMRRMSLRGMRHSVALFLHHALVSDLPTQELYQVVAAYWSAAVRTWPHAWHQARKHMLTKGIGVQGLSLLAADVVNFALREGDALTEATFELQFGRLKDFDWSNTGPLRGLGGRSGAREVHVRLARQLFPPRRLAVAR